jgi:hypothetical protein
MNTARFSTGRGSISNTWWTAIFLLLIMTVSDPLNVPSKNCGWGNGQRGKTNYRCYKINHARRNRHSCFLNHTPQFCDCKCRVVINKIPLHIAKQKPSVVCCSLLFRIPNACLGWDTPSRPQRQALSSVDEPKVFILTNTKFGCIA